MENYLQIGSDYAAGVVFFGIKETELGLKNPPVYMLHEADELADWKIFANTLSEYLMCVLLDALAGVEYSTAQNVLNKNGWEFSEEKYANIEQVRERLSREKIDLSAMVKNMSLYGATDPFYRYCFDEEEKAFYMVINDTSILVIKAE